MWLGPFFAWWVPKQDLDKQVFVQMCERSWKMKKFLRGGWLLCLALVATGCGGSDPQETDALSSSASARSEQSPGVQKSAASDQLPDGFWRLATSPSATEWQADESRSGASPVMTKAAAISPEVSRFLNPQTTTTIHSSAGTVVSASAAGGQLGPTVRLSAKVANMPFGKKAVTLSWTSSGVTTCSASGGWSGARNTWGSANAGVLSADTVFTLVCSGPKGPAARSVLVPVAAGSGTFMGSSKVLIGGAMPDATAAAAPFDVRYRYIHSRPAASPAYYTDSRCSDAAVASGWWGCWGGTWVAPGNDVTYENNRAAQVTWQGSPRPQIFFWTWYSLRDLGDMAGQGDGPGEVQAINRLDLLRLYMNDYRFFLQKIGNSRNMIDLEPDFWGYVRSLGNPHNVPAKVAAANPTDCATEENSAAGLARCLISMARKYAPNTAVGMHVSCWDWQNNLQGCRQDYLNLGAANADFLVADVSDRDAGWYALPEHGGHNNFWTDQKAAATLAFYKTMAETVGKPMVLWQIPVGNMAQNNTINHFQDDKVDWLLTHMDEVADAHIAGLLFGAGHGEQTGPEHDGGNLVNKTINLWNAGGTPLR